MVVRDACPACKSPRAKNNGQIPWANSPLRFHAALGHRAAKHEVRVLARGRASSHATMQSLFIAAAIAMFYQCVCASPR
jgi:hypothetical protein